MIRGLPEDWYVERATASPRPDGEVLMNDSHFAVESTVIAFCRDTLNVTVFANDIASAHPMKPGTKGATRTFIVCFVICRKRVEVYCSKKVLKDIPPVYISENLTKSVANLFYGARKRQRDKKLLSTWTQGGQLFSKFLAHSIENLKLIRSIADFNSNEQMVAYLNICSIYEVSTTGTQIVQCNTCGIISHTACVGMPLV